MNTVRSIDAHPTRATNLLVPGSAKIALGALGADCNFGRPHEFSLRRSKRGTEVWFHFPGGLSVNESLHLNVWPASFVHARQWIKEQSERLKLQLTERKKIHKVWVELRLVK